MKKIYSEHVNSYDKFKNVFWYVTRKHFFEVRSLKSAVGCLRFRKCSIGPELCGEKLYVEFHGTNLILDFFKKSYLWFWNMLFLWSRSQCQHMDALSEPILQGKQAIKWFF